MDNLKPGRTPEQLKALMAEVRELEGQLPSEHTEAQWKAGFEARSALAQGERWFVSGGSRAWDDAMTFLEKCKAALENVV